jgi:fucose permease
MLSAGLAPKVLYRRGYLVSIKESLIMVLLSQVIFYLAPNFVVILIGCILMGYGVGVLSVIQNVLVLIASPKDKINQVVNGLHANYAAASLLAPLIVAVIFGKGFPFESVFLVGASLCFVLLIYSYRVSKIKEPEKQTVPQFGALLKLRYVPIGIMLSSYVAGEVLVSSRLSQFLIDTHHFSSEKASLWTSLFFLSLLIGRLVFTIFHFAVTLKKLLTVLLVMAISISIMGIFVRPEFLLFLGFVVSPLYAMIMVMAKKEFPQEIEQITSLVIVLSGIFIIVMHTIVGWLTDHFSIQAALYLAPAFFSLCLVILKGPFHEH